MPSPIVTLSPQSNSGFGSAANAAVCDPQPKSASTAHRAMASRNGNRFPFIDQNGIARAVKVQASFFRYGARE
jgi:hypothetical protein